MDTNFAVQYILSASIFLNVSFSLSTLTGAALLPEALQKSLRVICRMTERKLDTILASVAIQAFLWIVSSNTNVLLVVCSVMSHVLLAYCMTLVGGINLRPTRRMHRV